MIDTDELERLAQAATRGRATQPQTILTILAELRVLREVMMADQPWSLVATMQKLVQGIEHLHHHHDCDHAGWEEFAMARKTAERWLAKYDPAIAAIQEPK